MTDIRYWVGLSLVPEVVGPVVSRKLISEIGRPENIFRAGADDLLAVGGLGKGKAHSIRALRNCDLVEKIVKVTDKKGIRIVGYKDLCYPDVLKEVAGAPLVLYMKGDCCREETAGHPQIFPKTRADMRISDQGTQSHRSVFAGERTAGPHDTEPASFS